MSKIRFEVCKLLLLSFILLFTINIQSFGQKVSGTVVDETSSPLTGVNVVLKGTKTAAITDLEGNYNIEVPNIQTDVLVFTFFGMETQEIVIGGSTQIDVAMTGSATVLGEVVAIGYGTAKKKDITGSVSSVQGKDLALIPVSTAAEALTGKMAGVQVVTTEGSPDASINIRVRGGGSITQDNSPLYIVDGFPVGSISDIPASEIQSIDVLKDASSTAIYGARGANGVIIITTKSGIEGKVKVSYNAYYGNKRVAKKLNPLGVEDYVKWQYEFSLLNNSLDTYQKFFGSYDDIDLFTGQPSNNWFEQVFGFTGKTFNHDLSITGGSDKFRYSFGYAGINSKEIMMGSKFNRDNISLKLDHKPSSKVNLSFSLRYSDQKIYGAGATDQISATPNDARVKQTMLFGPVPFTAMADYDDEEVSSTMINPLDNVRDNDRQQFRKRYNMGANFSWKITKDLEFRTEGGLDFSMNNDDKFFGMTTYYIKNTPAAEYQLKPALESTESKNISLRNANILTYDFKELLSGTKHNLKILMGQEILKIQSNTLFNQVHGFPTSFTSDLAYRLVSQGTSIVYTNTLNPDNNMLSFFGRLNYDFLNGRYLFTATFRADGSSKFAKENRWGYFPSFAAAWRISEEGFMKGISNIVNNLKLRISYGTAGNNNIPSNQIIPVFIAGSSEWINGFTSFWAPSNALTNPDLKWETTYTRNAGLDFDFFKSRINGSVELYYNTTKDLLINFPISGTGYATQYRNMGETENKGVELSLNGILANKKNFGLNIGFNIGFNMNKIISLGIMNDFGMNSSWASTEIGIDYWISKGGSVGVMYGYQNDGRYEVSDFNYNATTNTWSLKEGVTNSTPVVGALRPGMMKLKDIDGDGIVNVNDNTEIGNANPDHTGGMNIDARFYGFDLSAVFSWSYGGEVYNANKIEYTTGRYQFRNMIDIMADGKRWTNLDPTTGLIVNDPATLEAMNTSTTMWSPYMGRHVFSDWAVEDGSFLRLNTLSLGYTLPHEILKRVNIQNLRFYVSAYNVFVLTKYSGFDPEVSSRRVTGLTPSLDYSAYPKSRQLLFGINLTF
jgi:TonB-dependent starch-binding outer membrane protein SusC